MADRRLPNRLVQLELHEDDRGCLTTVQATKDIPFEVKRVYTIFEVGEGARRGCHAHKQEQQLIVCLSGRCLIDIDSGHAAETYELNNPREGLLLTDIVWREMHDFSRDCVLMILSDSLYDPCDYIRDYDEFIELVQEKRR